MPCRGLGGGRGGSRLPTGLLGWEGGGREDPREAPCPREGLSKAPGRARVVRTHLPPVPAARAEGTQATFPSSRALMRKSARPCLQPKVSNPRVTEQAPPRGAGPQGLRTGPAPGGGALTPRLWDEEVGGPAARVQGPCAGPVRRARWVGTRGAPSPPLAGPAVGDTTWGPACGASPRPGTGPPRPHHHVQRGGQTALHPTKTSEKKGRTSFSPFH